MYIYIVIFIVIFTFIVAIIIFHGIISMVNTDLLIITIVMELIRCLSGVEYSSFRLKRIVIFITTL